MEEAEVKKIEEVKEEVKPVTHDYLHQKVSTGIILVALGALLLVGSSTLYLKYQEILKVVELPPLQVRTNEYFNSFSWKEVTSKAPWERRDSQESYQWNGKLYMFGGLDGEGTLGPDGMPQYEKAKYFNDIWVTEDGKHWSLVVLHSSLPYLRSISIIPFMGKLYLYAGWGPEVGFNKKIYTSVNGVDWTIATTTVAYPGREGQRVLEHAGKLYMFGGVDYEQHKQFNDVWASDDGLTWYPLTTNAPWHGRWDHDVAVLGNDFYIVSGMSSGTVGYDDVWKSSDSGVHWTLIATSTPLGKKQGHVILTYRDALWLIGGLDTKSNEGKGEAWYSRNGFVWRKVPVDGLWEGREDHQAVLFKDKIFVFGGMGSSWHWKGDIWEGSLAP